MGFYVAGAVVACRLVELDGLLLHLVSLPEHLVEVALDARGKLTHHHALHHLTHSPTQLLHHLILQVRLGTLQIRHLIHCLQQPSRCLLEQLLHLSQHLCVSLHY